MFARPARLELEDPEKPTSPRTSKTRSNSPPAAKNISFSIVVISVPLLYLSLLHASLASLFNDTRFWFLMSNAIILIVAADSGVFAAAADGEWDIYQEYVEHSRSGASGVPLQEPPRMQREEKEQPSTCLALVPSQSTGEEEPSNRERCSGRAPQTAAPDAAAAAEVVESKGGPFLSASEKKGHMSSKEEEAEEKEEESEYAAMSDDELNRRVEEFIRRFNREIRRQM